MKKLCLVCGLLLAGAGAQRAAAQLVPPGGPQPGGGPANPTATPLDGGASLLLAGGLAYGLKRLRARRAAR